MITNEVPVTILRAYFSLPRENFKGESCLNVITPFTIIVVVLQLRGVPKTVIWVNQNGGAQAVVRGGGTAPLAPS